MTTAVVETAEATQLEGADSPPGPERLRRTDWVVLLGLVAASAIASFVDLGSRSLWNDEFITALLSTAHGRSMLSALEVQGGYMSAYFLVVHGVTAVFGDGAIALRLTSAFAQVGLTAVAWFLGRRMFGTRVAVLAAAFIAVSPSLVVWSQQARGYSLGVLLVASSFLSLLRFIDKPSPGRFAVVAVLLVLSIYTLVYAGLFLVAQWAPLLFWPPARRRLRSIAALGVIAAIAYVPLVYGMLTTTAAGALNSNGAPTTTTTVNILETLAMGRASEFFLATGLAGAVLAVAALGWLLSTTELLSLARRKGATDDTVFLGVTVSWLFAPLLLDLIFSLTYRSLWEPAYLLQSVPAAALLTAFAVVRFAPVRYQVVAGVGVAALLIAALIPTYGVSYEEWRPATRYIAASVAPGDCLTVNQPTIASNLAYSLLLDHGPHPRLVLPERTWENALDLGARLSPSHQAFGEVAGSCRRLWFVISRTTPVQLQFLIDPELAWFHEHGFVRLRVRHFTPVNGFPITVALLSR